MSTVKPETTAQQIEREQRLAVYEGEDRVESAEKVLAAYKASNPKGESTRTGIPFLDSIIGGFYRGQLVVVSGTTGHGKSTLCQSFTMAMAEDHLHPLWLSYEMTPDELLLPFEQDPSYMRHVHMPMTLKSNTMVWIEDRIIEAYLKYESKVIFIDHIHYLVEMNPRGNMSMVIGETVRGLKQLALKHNMIIFLVAHTTKTITDKPEDELCLGDIRDSSFIEQEADTVLYVWRLFNDQNVTVCKVAKNRKKGRINDKIKLWLKDGRYTGVRP